MAREAARDSQENSRQLIGAIRAAASAQGIDAGSGLGADLQADVSYSASRDMTRILNNAALEAWGYRVMARGEDFQGKASVYRGRIGAATSILNAGASYGLFMGGGGGVQAPPPQ